MTLRVFAVADSDSYLKWAAGMLDQLPAGWERRLAVVRSPITPSEAQIRSAISGTGAERPQVVPARRLRGLLRAERPDAVLLACTGPVVSALAPSVLSMRPRPALVTGLPGISVPASARAWRFRAAADLFVVHSRREAGEFTALAAELGLPGRVGLARLPFLTPAPPAAVRDRVIFATQAKVPAERADRERVLTALAELAGRRADLRVVVKTRARQGEQQTHREQHDYARIWAEMAGAGGDRELLDFDAGPMRTQLAHAAGFVTVSSTAALEAIAAAVPLLVLSDFGVSAEAINLVFAGSGLLGTLDDLSAAGFREPDPAWCAANYFHDPAESTWLGLLTGLLGGELPEPPSGLARRRVLSRSYLRLTAPPGLVRLIQAGRTGRTAPGAQPRR